MYVASFDEYWISRTQWIELVEHEYKGLYFDFFGTESVSKDVQKFNGYSNNIWNISRIQSYDLIIY